MNENNKVHLFSIITPETHFEHEVIRLLVTNDHDEAGQSVCSLRKHPLEQRMNQKTLILADIGLKLQIIQNGSKTLCKLEGTTSMEP